MGLMIGCPYFQHEKRKTITCEGRLKYFSEKEKKTGYLKNICEKDYQNCKYYKDLQNLYNECRTLNKTETALRLKSFYLEENRKTVKHLVQQLGIMERNVAHNIAVKQVEIDNLRRSLDMSDIKEGLALMELAAVMWEHGIESVNLTDIEKFREKYIASFEVADADTRRIKLVVKEREKGESL